MTLDTLSASPAPIWDLIIIGAGVSGLSIAQDAARAGLHTLILEQDCRIGGCLHSHRFTGELDGFWLELGAHSAFNSYGNLLALLESAGALNRLQRRAKVSFRLYADGAVRSIPSQLYFSELLLAPFRWLGSSKIGRSVADYFGPIVGPRNYRAVFEPAFSAVICQPAGEFPADSLFNPRPRRKDVPRGFTLPGGLQTLAEIFAQQPGVTIECGQAVQEVRRAGHDFIVRTNNGEVLARSLCLATPVAVAACLLQTGFPALAERLAEISTAEVETVGIAVPKSVLQLPPVAGLIGRNQAFYSVVSRDVVPDERYRGFTFHFRPGVLDAADQWDCIAQTLNLPHEMLTTANVVNKTNQLPALRVGHGERTRDVDRMLAGTRLALTGNYFTGVAIEDCVIRSRQEWGRLQREIG
ncbi:MAG TPA: FAD-dependent oxidoreductase [Candidatus Competibacteraceae bacterium]|nr:FAD-dependent oxidoreductase [Candidatus Competibacteraceae bacterium]HRZ04971.1 FAD-dependent oxidoreductase [Candidatus Competibacteraceae bacterium]HSA46382.1 FAD-dependent oxidoreductase [Candidatus Competibacteraceae bacterium]